MENINDIKQVNNIEEVNNTKQVVLTNYQNKLLNGIKSINDIMGENETIDDPNDFLGAYDMLVDKLILSLLNSKIEVLK